MKIYRLSYGIKDLGGGDNGTMLSWFSSEAAAKKDLAQMRRDDTLAEAVPVAIRPMEIEATRAGILHFLNNHFTTDNG